MKRVFTNAAWLFFDRLLRAGLTLLVGAWMARYLGPVQFGHLSYALALVALLGAPCSLGLNSVVVRDLVNSPVDAPRTLGTAFMLQIVGGVFATTLILLLGLTMRADDPTTKSLVLVLSLSCLFRAADVSKYWFEAGLLTRYSVWAENTVLIVGAAARVLLIIWRAPLLSFAWLFVAEAACTAGALFFMYAKISGQLRFWTSCWGRGKQLLLEAWPLLLSGLAVMVYMRVDQIMLGQIAGPEPVGQYSAALRLSEAWYMIPTIVVASVFPGLVEAKRADPVLFNDRVQKLFSFLVLIALAAAVLTTFLAQTLVVTLFGSKFAPAASILKIHVWTGIFVFLGVASNQWYLLEGMNRALFYRTMLGAVANVALNVFFIPAWGAVGAAAATIISQSLAAFFFDMATKRTRVLFRLKVSALLLRGIRGDVLRA